jgi:anti-sigma regulatory factor (Ser/Thr protein kinase)
LIQRHLSITTSIVEDLENAVKAAMDGENSYPVF